VKHEGGGGRVGDISVNFRFLCFLMVVGGLNGSFNQIVELRQHLAHDGE
jgi:hypothetical protein